MIVKILDTLVPICIHSISFLAKLPSSTWSGVLGERLLPCLSLWAPLCTLHLCLRFWCLLCQVLSLYFQPQYKCSASICWVSLTASPACQILSVAWSRCYSKATLLSVKRNLLLSQAFMLLPRGHRTSLLMPWERLLWFLHAGLLFLGQPKAIGLGWGWICAALLYPESLLPSDLSQVGEPGFLLPLDNFNPWRVPPPLSSPKMFQDELKSVK